MSSFFNPREQRLALYIVGDGDTELALVRGMKKIIQESGLLPENLEVTIKSLKRGGGNPSNAFDLAQRKHFSNPAIQRRVLIVDSEGTSVDEKLFVRAAQVGVEMKLSEPCIERHLMLACGLSCPANVKANQYKKAVSTHFGTDFHPCDSDWHAKQIRNFGLEQMVERDELIAFIHEILTSTDHPSYS